MIINRTTKAFLSRSDRPNENWTDEIDIFVVDDESDLASRVIANYPYFEFVLDAQGNLIDITLTERPPDPIPPKTEVELLKEELDTTKEAVNFLLMNLI